MYNTIITVKDPKYLVITPLKPGDRISPKTEKTVKSNKIPFDWVSYTSNNNVAMNTSLALKEYEKSKYVKFLIKIDNDIDMEESLLDDMYQILLRSSYQSDNKYGYVYCPFSYLLPDGRTIKFENDFDIEKLLNSNYISSNSMILVTALKSIGGFVTDPQYERLLDWALWLKLFKYGWIGKFYKDKKFQTPLNDDNISARGKFDYDVKHMRVVRDFANPIIRDMIKKGTI